MSASTSFSRVKKFCTSPYLLLTLTALFWSGNWVVGRAMRDQTTPISLAFWRWVLAWLILMPFAWPHVWRDWPLIRKSWRILVILGLLGTGTYNALSYMGLQYTSVTNAVMMNSVTPILIAAIAWAFFGEKLNLRQGIGITVSLVGVLCILTRADLQLLIGLRFNVGDLWVFASMVTWSMYTVVLRWRPADLHPLAFLAALASVGLIALMPLYFFTPLGGSITLSPPVVAALAYVGIFPSVVAYIFWNRGVQQVGGNIAGLFMHLMPVFGTVLALMFLGETLHAYHFIALALILGGLWMTAHFGRNVSAGVKAEE